MVKWQALGPISVVLETRSFSHDNITLCKYNTEQLDELLKEDKDYWSKVYFSLRYAGGYWLNLDLEVDQNEKSWTKALERINLFLQALGLFKSTKSLLAIGGLRLKRIEKGSGTSGHFGAEKTIIGKPKYLLRKSEYDSFIDLLTRYRKFFNRYTISPKSNKQLLRINSARNFYFVNLQTMNLVERYIFLSIALEALYGEGQQELKYRYSNRSALLLGDDIKRRKDVYYDVQNAYKKRSDILHGRVSWRIKPKEVFTYNEIIRQSILRCISLYTQGYRNIGKALDECMHDPDKQARLLEDARAFFGSHSKYKETEESARLSVWSIRN
jgi:hypothetical protein